MRTPLCAADDPAMPSLLASVWRAGGLAAFPTETVYGVGAADGLPEALARLRALKGRDADKPFQLLAADLDAARAATGTWRPAEERLAAHCWPGPLTLILPGRADGEAAVPDVGVRIPAHAGIRAALARLGRGVWASSANAAGMAPCPSAAAAAAWGGEALALVVDGPVDPCGTPSTVARIDGGEVRVLRSGAWEREALVAIAFGKGR